MESRYFKVAGIPFEIAMESPWRIMEYTPVVKERISRAARGEEIDIEPCRAGDEVPSRTFIRSKEELPEGRTRYDLNLSQYEPFRCDPCTAGFTLTIRSEEPSWIAQGKEDGSSRLIISVDDTLPHYFIYRNGERTIFEFEAEVGNVVGTLVIGEEARTGDFYPKAGRSASGILYQVSTAAMIMFTYQGALRSTLLMHSSVVRHNGKANMFLGTSGTGKSTHSRLWLENIEGCDLINDDNPAISVSEDGKVAYVHGTPWSGKTPCYRNISVPVRAIVRLQQAPHNRISPIDGLNAYICIISSASSIRWEKKVMDGLTRTAEKIVGCVKCRTLECLPDADAAITCMKDIEA